VADQKEGEEDKEEMDDDILYTLFSRHGGTKQDNNKSIKNYKNYNKNNNKNKITQKNK
jgi:hypothetical protein